MRTINPNTSGMTSPRSGGIFALAFSLAVHSPGLARAGDDDAVEDPEPTPPLETGGASSNPHTPGRSPEGPSPNDKKKRYTLPFALRPVIAPNIVRVDGAYALKERGTTTASTLAAGFKPFDSVDLGFYARFGFILDAPDGRSSSAAIGNPSLFALFTPEIAPGLRLGFYAGSTIPVGMGGGDVAPDNPVRAALSSATYTRQAMDGALFSPNYLTPSLGLGVAWIDDGFTLQAETTLFVLARVRGASVDKEATRVNFTSGVHAGYLIANLINIGVEAHYQRWVSTPASVVRDGSARDQATFGGGLRANVPIGDSVLARPGIAYFHPIDDPMAKTGYRILQLDVPVAF